MSFLSSLVSGVVKSQIQSIPASAAKDVGAFLDTCVIYQSLRKNGQTAAAAQLADAQNQWGAKFRDCVKGGDLSQLALKVLISGDATANQEWNHLMALAAHFREWLQNRHLS